MKSVWFFKNKKIDQIDSLETVEESMARLFDDETNRSINADLTFRCMDDQNQVNGEWRVHSFIIRRVPLFATMLDR